MTTEQVEELAGRLAESDLFICVTMKRGHSQEALYGETYKLIGVAFNTLLSAIDELETTEEQIAQMIELIRELRMILKAIIPA